MNAFCAGKRHVLLRIHDVITRANPFQYTAKFIFVHVRNDKTQQI